MQESEQKDSNLAGKAFLGLIGTILSTLIVSTWNTVNNSSLDIVRLQGRTTTIEEKITELKDNEKERIQVLDSKLTNVEARVTLLERAQKK